MNGEGGALEPTRASDLFTDWRSATNANADWNVLVAPRGREDSSTNTFFRLAGTFFQYAAMGTQEVRKAILDEIASSTQHIVSEGDVVAGTRVVGIYADHVVIADGRGESSLWLTFKSADSTGTNQVAAGATNAGFNRYGTKQIGPARWVFRRDPLLKYYAELMDQPERLVKVFDSLKPVYTPANRIEGYRLDVEGEGEFFEAVGLRQSDVVRTVNSLPMTSRNRAEFFIKQFVADRANAFVIEVERGQKREKLVYEVR
jgi:type II secretory pathway component PulC